MAIRALVVDDNVINLKLAANILLSEGFEVMKAERAESALELIKSSPPQVILMDVSLPGMDGLTLTKMLKENEATKHICIIALTAFAMKGDDEKAYAAGCDGYIPKPIDTRKLTSQIEEVLLRMNQSKPTTPQ